MQQGVGHYGVFNGTRWRTEIQPRIREFIQTINYRRLANGEKATRMQQAYRVLESAIDVAPEWRPKSNGSAERRQRQAPAGPGRRIALRSHVAAADDLLDCAGHGCAFRS